MGDNLIELSKKNPNKQIIGIEPFLNGIASVVYSCVKSNINNILLYSHPVQEFLKKSSYYFLIRGLKKNTSKEDLCKCLS